MSTKFYRCTPKLRSQVKWYRQQAWLVALRVEYGIDQAALARALASSDEEKNSNIYAWYQGKRAARRSSIDAVETLYPGSRDIFDFPVWTLLGAEILRPKHIAALQKNIFKSAYVPSICTEELSQDQSARAWADNILNLYTEMGVHLWQLPRELASGGKVFCQLADIDNTIADYGTHTILAPLTAIRKSQFEDSGLRFLVAELQLEQSAANFLSNPVFALQSENLTNALLSVVEEASYDTRNEYLSRWRSIYQGLKADSVQPPSTT